MLFCEKWAKNNDRMSEILNCVVYKLLLFSSVFLIPCAVYTNKHAQLYTQFNVILTLCSQFAVARRQHYIFSKFLFVTNKFEQGCCVAFVQLILDFINIYSLQKYIRVSHKEFSVNDELHTRR